MTAHVMRRRVDATGRSTGKLADPRSQKANSPPKNEPWIWLTQAILESFAWRALSGGAQKVVCRVALEHMLHGGSQNGDLPVPWSDFETYGIGSASVLPALEEAIAVGLIQRTDPGHKAWGGFKGRAARYRLCWLPTHDGHPAVESWRRFESLAEARKTATAARQSVTAVREQARDENTILEKPRRNLAI
ncbi:hypothetical protein [Methylobacterium sp. Leaf361]|uniref:hypothetical protein n=1 Tax=Methylobacterium sp. Leaf361 TaxID=1736352 RepID=UPI0012FEA052|nr:hypothetical protein [Methylobacterium sp. Leaf361]